VKRKILRDRKTIKVFLYSKILSNFFIDNRMEKQIIEKIREKKEFSYLPEGIVKRVLDLKEIRNKKGDEKVKLARAILRKYFSVFLSNKLLGGKLEDEEVLKKHLSSKDRDYKKLYEQILDDENTILDFGAGLNGFSLKYAKEEHPELRYVAIEAIKPFVDLMNNYFRDNRIKDSMAIHADLFDLDNIIKILQKLPRPLSIWMFNIVDALELERDYTKKFLLEIKARINEGDRIVISFPTQSLSGKTKFKAKRYWLLSFLEENFSIVKDFEMQGERFLVLRRE